MSEPWSEEKLLEGALAAVREHRARGGAPERTRSILADTLAPLLREYDRAREAIPTYIPVSRGEAEVCVRTALIGFESTRLGLKPEVRAHAPEQVRELERKMTRTTIGILAKALLHLSRYAEELDLPRNAALHETFGSAEERSAP